MKTKLFSILAFTLCAFAANAQTNVGGTLMSNTTWVVSGSPYNITSNLGVPSGVTLMIDAGVTVNFNTASQIIVQGNLIANGSLSTPIIFNGNTAGNAMILFQKTTLNSSSLSFITLNGPKDGIRLSTNTSDNNSGTLTINNLHLNNSKIETNGYSSNAQLVINNSKFSGSVVNGDYPLSEVIKINNSSITNGNIVSYGYNNGVFLNNDSVSGTIMEVGCCGGNLNISGSVINNAYFDEAQGSQPGSSNSLNIDGSAFQNSEINMPVSTVTINKSTFSYNISYSKPSCIVSGNGVMDSSIFSGNGSLIAVERGPNGFSYDNNSPWTFTHCSFSGFATDIKINAATGSTFGSGAVSMHYCDFLDRPSGFIVNNNSPHDANAMNNWWGTTATTAIDSSIHDFWDDMADGKVIYTGYLTAPSNASTSIVTFSTGTVSVYPNPFAELLVINSARPGCSLVIYNSVGQEILKMDRADTPTKIDTKDFVSGVYLVQLRQNGIPVGQTRLIKQ